MARDTQSLRRRAAVAVLSDVLDENTLLQELWHIQDSLRGDSVTEIINCVDAVARRQLLDAGTAKRLYAEFFKALRLPEAALPLDPWPAMQSLRPQPATVPVRAAAAVPAVAANGYPQPLPPVQAPVAQAFHVAPAASVPVTPAPVAEPLAAAALAPEPPLVFGAVMRAVIGELQRFHRDALDEIRNDAMRALAGCTAPASLREQFGRAWERPGSHDWKLQGHPDDLAALTGVVHKALDMAFGRAGADQILRRAIESSVLMPEARSYSPMRLMSAL